VILSDERISSPYLKVVDTAIILNQQSMDKFEHSVKPGGVLIYDPNGITIHPSRTDINIFQIEGTKLAAEMGNKKIFNMVILGGFLKIKPIIKLDNVIEGLKKSISERYHNLIPLNMEAITMGMKSIVPYKVEESVF
jgi:2-oxoglutarate ferredoxin oxidoreductase subunit gamma